MRRSDRLSVGVLAVVATLVGAAGEAMAQPQAQAGYYGNQAPPPPSEPSRPMLDPDSPAVIANRGLHVGIGPVILFPTRSDGPYGLGLMLDGRYGIEAGPTILAPGGRVSGLFISERFLGILMPTFRVTAPLGPLAPYVLGGVGPGYISSPQEAGVALLGGGGLTIHFGRVLALGCEVSYQVITCTEFKSLTIGPSISLGL